MPDDNADNTTIEISPNPVIKALKATSKDKLGSDGRAQRAVTIVGYPGSLDVTAEFLDLYLDLDLSAYYRIRKDEFIVPPTLNQDPEQDPTKPIKVLVRASANIELVIIGEASFLTGRIAATLPLGSDDPTHGAGPARNLETSSHRNCPTQQ